MKKDWQIKRLGDVLIIERGGSPRPIKKYITNSPDGLNWIKISDATASDKYIYETKEKITKEGLSKTRFVKEGDFLLSNSMSFGRPYIMKTTGCIHDGWLVLKEKDKKYFDTEFLYYLLSSPFVFNQFDDLAAGSTVRNLNIALVSSVKVPIPPFPEQQRIVSLLDHCFEAIDKAKANAEQNLQNAKEVFESYLQGVFEKKGTDWRKKKLKEIISYDKKQSIHQGLPYVGLQDIESNSGIFLGNHQPREMKSTTFHFNNKHVLYGRLRPYLNKVMLPDFEGHCSTEIFPITVNDELIREFLFYWLISNKTVDKINATCTGARMPRANMNQVLDFDFSYPSIKEQKNIVLKLEIVRNETQQLQSHYQKKIDNLEELKQSILQKAFAGELKTEKVVEELEEIQL